MPNRRHRLAYDFLVQRRIYTVGHSTHPLEEFLAILRAHDIEAIADVRRYPRSRKHPQFNDDALARSLPTSGIAYRPFKDLGGRRRPVKDSPNTGWRSESFRGYADYLRTDAFRAALAELERQAVDRPTAIMCAEAVPWRCHRSLIADALLVRGWVVMDITGTGPAKQHELTPFAVVRGTEITYPKPADQPTLFTDQEG